MLIILVHSKIMKIKMYTHFLFDNYKQLDYSSQPGVASDILESEAENYLAVANFLRYLHEIKRIQIGRGQKVNTCLQIRNVYLQKKC